MPVVCGIEGAEVNPFVGEDAGASYSGQPTITADFLLGGLWQTGAGAVALADAGYTLTLNGATINSNPAALIGSSIWATIARTRSVRTPLVVMATDRSRFR